MEPSQNSTLEMYRLDIEELAKLIETAKRPNNKRQLEAYKKNLEIQMKEEEKKIAKKESEAKTEGQNDEKVQTDSQNIALNFQTVTKYALDTSSDKFVKVYLTDGFENLKTLNSQNIKSKFTKKSFDVCIVDWQKKNYRFSCFNLNKEIIPEDSYTKATGSGLIIYLAKKAKGDYWESLEKKKGLLDKDGEEGEKVKDKDPNASLMEMMRDMYQNGDPEMKKMIAEAWTKSQDEQKNKEAKK